MIIIWITGNLWKWYLEHLKGHFLKNPVLKCEVMYMIIWITQRHFLFICRSKVQSWRSLSRHGPHSMQLPAVPSLSILRIYLRVTHLWLLHSRTIPPFAAKAGRHHPPASIPVHLPFPTWQLWGRLFTFSSPCTFSYFRIIIIAGIKHAAEIYISFIYDYFLNNETDFKIFKF